MSNSDNKHKLGLATSPQGLHFIEVHEAPGGNPELKAYQDEGGIWTIGYGHTHGVHEGQTITSEQAEQFLKWDVHNAEASIFSHINIQTLRKLERPAFDAIVDFVFNLGPIVFWNKDGSITGFHKAMKGCHWNAVCREMLRWDHDNGKVVEGLKKRREDEVLMFRRGMGMKDAIEG